MDGLIDVYKNLDIYDKRNELADELSEFISIIQKLKADIGEKNNSDVLFDLDFLYDEKLNEDQYLTNLYKNILNIKEELAIYLNKVTDLYYENENVE